MLKSPEGDLVCVGLRKPLFQFGLVSMGPRRLFSPKHPQRRPLLELLRPAHRVSLLERRRPYSGRRIFPLPPSMKSTSARIPCVICFSTVSAVTPNRSAVSRVVSPSTLRSHTTSLQRDGS